MTSNMVYYGENPTPGYYPGTQHAAATPDSKHRNSLFAQANDNDEVPSRLALPKINPRDGATEQSMLWELALEQL